MKNILLKIFHQFPQTEVNYSKCSLISLQMRLLLLMMVAQVCGLEPGDFVHTLGDAHLYLNHLEQARHQGPRGDGGVDDGGEGEDRREAGRSTLPGQGIDMLQGPVQHAGVVLANDPDADRLAVILRTGTGPATSSSRSCAVAPTD